MPISKIKISSITADASSVNLNIDAGTLYLDAANNNVAVGTTSTVSPGVRLTLNSAAFASLWSRNDPTLGYSQFYFGNEPTNVSPQSGYQFLRADGRNTGYISLGTNDTERLRIDINGNVGIGIVPSSWSSTYVKAIQLGNKGGAIAGFTSSVSVTPYMNVINNGYFASDASWKYYNGSYGVAFYQQAGNEHRFNVAATGATDGTISFNQAMTLDAGGNLGVGTASPQSRLHVGSGWVGIHSDITTSTAVPSWQITRITGEIHANAGVSSGSDGGLLRLSAGGETSTSQKAGIDMSGYNTTDGGPTLRFYTGSERMRISQNGAVSIGITNSYGTAGSLSGPFGRVDGISANPSAIVWGIYGNGGGMPQYCGNWASSGSWGIGPHSAGNDGILRVGYIGASSAGATWSTGYVNIYAGAYTNASDYRIKKNVENLSSVLDGVLQLRPVTYNLIHTPDEDGDTPDEKDEVGFIAHEIQEFFPVLVNGTKDEVDVSGREQHQGVDYAKMSAILVKAMQEQQAIITQLTERITALEAK